jgi:hypothetical protein
MVNATIAITGDDADAVTIEVWDAVTKTETIEPVYGSESVWATFTLPADGRLHVIANGANNSEIGYGLSIIDIPTPLFSWQGTSLAANTLNSTIEMEMPANGVYNITGDYAEGFASLLIDPVPGRSPSGVESDFEMNVELTAGSHTFVVMQGSSFPTSTWAYTVTLVSADAPTITAVAPGSINAGVETTITITGTNFLDGAVVTLTGGGATYTLATTLVSGSQVTAVVPGNVEIGTYTVTVTNPDSKNASLPDSLEIIKFYAYLPVVVKGN